MRMDMKGYWVLRTVSWVGIFASLLVIFLAGGLMLDYGFDFALAAMVALGVAGICFGGLYIDQLDQRWLTEENREPFPKLDLA